MVLFANWKRRYYLAGDLGFIENAVLSRLKQDIAERERMLMVLIKSLENKALNP